MAGNTIIVNVLGNTKSLTKSLKKAQADLAGLDRINQNIGAGFRTAAIGAAVFAAATVGAGAAGAAALAAVPAGIIGIGIAFAAQNEKVRKSFGNLKSYVTTEMQGMTQAFVPVLVGGAAKVRQAFDVIAPSLRTVFSEAAPVLKQAFAGLPALAAQVGPLITESFRAGVPVLQAFGRSITPIVQGLRGFFAALEGGNKSAAFVGFVDQLGQSLKALLPALGRLLTNLAPIGTVILGTLVPALISLMDWVGGKVGPAFAALTGAISEHPTLFRNIGIAIISVVAGLKAIGVAVAVYNAAVGAAAVVTSGFTAVMTLAAAAQRIFTAAAIGTRIQLALLAVQQGIVRAATIAWTAVQWLLNAALTANPIGLIVLAVAALVAAFIFAWKNSETFRNIVTGTWNAIKTAAVAVFNFLKGFITRTWAAIKTNVTVAVIALRAVVTAVWNAIKTVVSVAVRVVKTVVGTQIRATVAVARAAWNALKAATSAVWNAIKAVVSGVIRGVKSVVSTNVNAVKSVVTGAWNAAKSATSSIWNGIKNAVTTAVNGLMTVVNGIKSKVIGAFAGAATWLLSAGRNVIQGLINGIKAMASSAVSAAKDVVGSAVAGAKSLLGIASPSRVFMAIGRFTMQGLAKGFKQGRKGVTDAMGSIVEKIQKVMERADLGEKAIKAKTKTIAAYLRVNRGYLNAYATQVKKANSRVERAYERLSDIRKAAKDYAGEIAKSVKDYAALGNLNSAFNATAMAQQMRDRIAKVRDFTATLSTLVANGLNANMVKQLAEAGVEGGLAYAQALAAGGPAAVREMNVLQAELGKASKSLGNVASNDLYGAGKAAARLTYQGLKDDAADAQKAATRFAKALTQKIRGALGFKGNRSREFEKVGRNIAESINKGLRDAPGIKYGRVSTQSRRPALSPQATQDRYQRAGDTINVTVHAPVGSDAASIGKELQYYLDQNRKRGGRTNA